MTPLFSSQDEFERIARIIQRYAKLPFGTSSIPGAVLEAVLATVRGGRRLDTYDFVDVIGTGAGWQVKSTKIDTPITWKRAKLPKQADLITASQSGEEGIKELGDAIIRSCNEHVKESFDRYDLSEIGYCRLIVKADRTVRYFERKLCDRDHPVLFNPDDFVWSWSTPKKGVKKEQLEAFHGKHVGSGRKWWSWHGLGENQLHFTGESSWWPKPGDPHQIDFELPGEAEKLSFEKFLELLEDPELSI